MKKVTFGGKPPKLVEIHVDDWVENREISRREPMKRLTIDISFSLHKRIKSQCVSQDLIMADVIRELLEQRFPKNGSR